MARYLRHVPAGRPSAIRVTARIAIAAHLGAAMRELGPLLGPLPAQDRQSVAAAVLRRQKALTAFAAALAARIQHWFNCPGATKAKPATATTSTDSSPNSAHNGMTLTY